MLCREEQPSKLGSTKTDAFGSTTPGLSFTGADISVIFGGHRRKSQGCGYDDCLRHLLAYGSTNMYRPVSMSKASGSSGE